jgi:hypothetical protein
MASIDWTTEVRISVPTLILVLAVIGGGAFAAGRALPTAPELAVGTGASVQPPPVEESEQETLPPGHPPIDEADEPTMPPGHPPVADPNFRAAAAGAGGVDSEDGAFEWSVPARWEVLPNASSMRLATYRVPRAPGDVVDAELSIARAGGLVDANVERWIGQFEPAARQARRTMRTVGLAPITMVEVQGTYSGGMGKDTSPHSGWALIGAIASTPGTPYFFKLTGPEKTVRAARGEFDLLVGSLSPSRKRNLP